MKIIDKYIFREFITPLLYCFFAFMLIFIVGDLFENLDNFIINSVSWSLILKYYFFMIPNVFVLTTPLAVLLSILYQLGYMSRYNELVALKSSGVNFWRIILPFGVLGIILSIMLFMANERLVPRCTMVINNIMETSVEKPDAKEAKKTGISNIHKNITFFSCLYNLSFFMDSLKNNEAEGVSIREFYKDGTLKREWYGKNAVWIDSGWWLFDGYIRQYDSDKGAVAGKVVFFKKYGVSINIPPKDLAGSQIYKESIYNYMNIGELLSYIKRNFSPANLPREYLIELYRKLCIPVTLLIVTLFGITFGARISRGGAMMSVGYSLMFYFAYYGVSSLFLAMGKMGRLLPLLAVWTPPLAFGIISGYLLKKTR